MLINKTDIDQLTSHSLFMKLSTSEIDGLLATAKQLDVNSGDVIFSQLNEAKYFYFVLSGKVKLYRIGPSGNEKVIEIIKESETFAEALMFMKQYRYPVNAEAIETSKILAIKSQPYLDILRQRTELCFDIMGSLSMRLHHRLQEIERLSLQNATDRLIHYLLSLTPETAVDQHEIVLDIPKRVLASRLSMLPETFSRALHKLSQEEILSVKAKTINILDTDRLRARYKHS